MQTVCKPYTIFYRAFHLCIIRPCGPTSTTIRKAAAQHLPHNQKRNMYHMASTIGEKTCICCYCCVHAPGCNCIPSGEPIISFLPTPTNELQETKVFFQAIFHKPRPVFPVNIYGGRN